MPEHHTAHEDRPQFARKDTDGKVELRVWVDKEIVAALDVEVGNRGGEGANVYRATVVNDLLRPWVDKTTCDSVRFLNGVHAANISLPQILGNPSGSAMGAAS